jgi:general secretion pathway protein A
MYQAHFKLSRKPFQITTDPKFLWLGEKYQEALAILKYGIMDNKGFLLLTGDVGTGKTTLINALVDTLGDETITAIISDPGLEALDLFKFIAEAFGLDSGFTRKGEFLLQFEKFLIRAHANRKRVLLVIDEAQRAPQELLEEIRMLSNLERQDTKLINIFFVGQNELNPILLRLENRALRQRIALNYNLNHLQRAEVDAYVRHRLKVAGTTEPIFEPAAIEMVSKHSGGYPRRINVLCDHCLVTAFVRGVASVNSEIVQECAGELAIPDYIEPPMAPSPPRRNAPPRPAQPALPAEPGGASDVKLEPESETPPRPQEPSSSLDEPAPAAAPKPASKKASAMGIAAGPQGPAPKRSVSGKLIWGLVLAGLAGLLVVLWQYPQSITRELNPSQGTESSGPAGDEAPASGPDPSAAPADTPPAAEQPPPTDEPPGEPNQSAAKDDSSSPTTADALEPAPAEGQVDDQPRVVGQVDDQPPFNGQKIIIPFFRDSNALAADTFAALDRLAAALQSRPQLNIEVRGYTDASGVYAYNLKLSEFRANMVKSYLVGKGIDSQRIRTQGLGPQDMLETGDAVKNRILSRRVEIEIAP